MEGWTCPQRILGSRGGATPEADGKRSSGIAIPLRTHRPCGEPDSRLRVLRLLEQYSLASRCGRSASRFNPMLSCNTVSSHFRLHRPPPSAQPNPRPATGQGCGQRPRSPGPGPTSTDDRWRRTARFLPAGRPPGPSAGARTTLKAPHSPRTTVSGIGSEDDPEAMLWSCSTWTSESVNPQRIGPTIADSIGSPTNDIVHFRSFFVDFRSGATEDRRNDPTPDFLANRGIPGSSDETTWSGPLSGLSKSDHAKGRAADRGGARLGTQRPRRSADRLRRGLS